MKPKSLSVLNACERCFSRVFSLKLRRGFYCVRDLTIRRDSDIIYAIKLKRERQFMDVIVDLSDIELETERLVLRQWKESDLEDFFEYASVDGVGEMAGWKHHSSIDESKIILDMFIREKNCLSIVLKASGKVIGSMGLHESCGNENAALKDLRQKEIGYVLSKDYWGRGLVPEAVKKMIEFCFTVLDLEAVTITHFKENDQSRRVIEKCGLKYIGEGKFQSASLNKDFDDKQYVLLRDDYIKQRRT